LTQSNCQVEWVPSEDQARRWDENKWHDWIRKTAAMEAMSDAADPY
jgi:hypothetical protein